MKTNLTKGDQRLLDVAQACRETQYPFDMDKFGSRCGSPACALGNYAVRKDLQREWDLVRSENTINGNSLCQPMALVQSRNQTASVSCDDYAVQRYFGLTQPEASDLFSFNGCGDAKTSVEAADYIERFVAKRVAARSIS